jgi:protein-S-isoprenylcysteine O-methyltransferase Ste14
MQRSAAGIGTAVFFVIAPGVVAGLVPWLITGWQVRAPATLLMLRMIFGGVLVAVALIVLVRAFVRFVTEGQGTPAPVAPTERLVVGGEYRFVRNPMYLAVITAVLGQAMIFGSLGLLLYAVALWAVMAAFVHWYEEPVLLERFGDEYDRYRHAVRAWLPRLHPWRPELDRSRSR